MTTNGGSGGDSSEPACSTTEDSSSSSASRKKTPTTRFSQSKSLTFGVPRETRYRMTGEWGSWLAGLAPWTHFFTGTFEKERKTVAAVARSFDRYLESLSGDAIIGKAFAVVEGDTRTRLHVHALCVLGWDAALVCPPTTLQRKSRRSRDARSVLAWGRWVRTRGRARCEPIQGTATGAAFYVAKYMLKTEEPRYFFLPDEAWGTNIRG